MDADDSNLTVMSEILATLRANTNLRHLRCDDEFIYDN